MNNLKYNEEAGQGHANAAVAAAGGIIIHLFIYDIIAYFISSA